MTSKTRIPLFCEKAMLNYFSKESLEKNEKKRRQACNALLKNTQVYIPFAGSTTGRAVTRPNCPAVLIFVDPVDSISVKF